jgi:hypothetical protein
VSILIAGKPVDLNKLGTRTSSTLFQKNTCGSMCILFLQLAKALLEVDGKIYSIAGHHSYVITENPTYYIDFSDGILTKQFHTYPS